jgi:hypothetical protein
VVYFVTAGRTRTHPASPPPPAPRAAGRTSSSSGMAPSRCLALVSAGLVGSATPSRCRSPFVSQRITDRYPRRAHAVRAAEQAQPQHPLTVFADHLSRRCSVRWRATR